VVSISGPITTLPPTTVLSNTTPTPGQTYFAEFPGDFLASESWRGGVAPSGACNVVIPFGIALVLTGSLSELNISTITIQGTLTIISFDTAAFVFPNVINIIVESGGSLVDLTFAHNFYFFKGSALTLLTGSFFYGAGTTFYVITALPANENIVNSYFVGFTLFGPLTLVVLNDNTFQYFDSIMCFPIGSGSFYDISIWPGGLVPTFEFCRSVGGCGFFLQPDLTVSMVFVNGILNIQFNTMIVCPNANLGLGDGSFNGPFQFAYSVIFVLYGQVAFFFPGFWLPFNSQFNCYPGSFIQADVSVIITIYDSITGVPNNQTATVAPGAGSYLFLTVSANGSTSTSTEGM
jgi:hypothetical protein